MADGTSRSHTCSRSPLRPLWPLFCYFAYFTFSTCLSLLIRPLFLPHLYHWTFGQQQQQQQPPPVPSARRSPPPPPRGPPRSTWLRQPLYMDTESPPPVPDVTAVSVTIETLNRKEKLFSFLSPSLFSFRAQWPAKIRAFLIFNVHTLARSAIEVIAL